MYVTYTHCLALLLHAFFSFKDKVSIPSWLGTYSRLNTYYFFIPGINRQQKYKSSASFFNESDTNLK